MAVSVFITVCLKAPTMVWITPRQQELLSWHRPPGWFALRIPIFYSGGTMIIDHGHGLSSSFLHLSEILVTVGTRIERGAPIAKVGATGRATGPHLDWRMNWRNVRVDPELVLETLPAQ